MEWSIEWYIPVLIFIARIADVSIGTLRTLFLINGSRVTAPALGFFEVVIWVLAVGGVIKYLPNPFAVLAYGGGYAAGTMLGMWVEAKLAIGYRMVRAINAIDGPSLAEQLRGAGFTATRVEGDGKEGKVELVYCAVRRKRLAELLEKIQTFAPKAFLTVDRSDHAINIEVGAPASPRIPRLGWLIRK